MKKISLYLLVILTLIQAQEIILIGNSNFNDLEMVTQAFGELEIFPRVWDDFPEPELIDSLLSLQQSIIIWEMGIIPGDSILFQMESILNAENSIAVFSNSIYDTEIDFFADIFGCIKIRGSFADIIYQLDNPEINWSMSDTVSITELGWAGSATPILGYSEEGEFAAVQKNHLTGKTYSAGFFLEDVEELPELLNELLSHLSFNPYQIVIENTTAFPGDTIYIPITVSVEEPIIGISLTLQCDPENLVFYIMEPDSGLEYFAWDVNQLPFGIVEINGAAIEGFLPPGEMEIGRLKAWLYPSASDKIGLRSLVNQLTLESGESTTALMTNGEIDVLFDYSIVELIPPSLIEPDSTGSIKLNLFTEHDIIALQFCLSYDQSLLGISDVHKTLRIPESWWVSFVNYGENNKSEIFCFGFSPLIPGTGPILDISFSAYTNEPQIVDIEFCDALLASTDNEGINNTAYGTTLLISNPVVIVNPQSVIADNLLDVVFQVTQNQQFYGFQFDLTYPPEFIIDNIFTDNMLENPIGGWSLIDEHTVRTIYFQTTPVFDQPQSGNLLIVSFMISENPDIELFKFEVKNVITTDFYSELIPTKFLDFDFNNAPTYQGDVNGDFSLDVFDLIVIVNFILETMESGFAQQIISDLNNDNILDIFDIIILVNIILDE